MNEVQERWAALGDLPAAWDKPMLARRDATIGVLTEPGRGATHAALIEKNATKRQELLLELELTLGLDSPRELQAQRLALQVQQLKDRFKSATASTASGGNSVGDRLLAWSALAGVCESRDRQRADRIFAKAALSR